MAHRRVFIALVICGTTYVLAEPSDARFSTTCAAASAPWFGLVSQPGVSKHLRCCARPACGAEGKRRWYGLRAEPLADVADWLEPYRRHWSARLDALERHLEENPK